MCLLVMRSQVLTRYSGGGAHGGAQTLHAIDSLDTNVSQGIQFPTRSFE